MLTLLICTYFITSSDSGTLVITTLLSIGDRIPRAAPRHLGAGPGAGGGHPAGLRRLGPLQAASIIAALPFSVIMLAMCYSRCWV